MAKNVAKNVETKNSFDVLVVGGGHAGAEAALVAARMGCRTAMLTFRRDRIGQMSCNPAIGGLGKGQLVKEIDALFGEMGLAIDDTGIQFRTLNSSKGPAVRSSRAQADRTLYRERIIAAVSSQLNLELLEGAAAALIVQGNRVLGVSTEDGAEIRARTVILTTGTFLQALMHTGEEKTKGGRVGEQTNSCLSDSIMRLGLRMGRMKTGTPPRLRRSSIDFSRLTEQPGDTPARPFSFRSGAISRPQISCWITNTTGATHEIIGANVERSPMFNGQIQSHGPRYCPSIEDKVFRFRNKETHNIFLEPEGFDSDVVYPNGISTSLPKDVQDSFVQSIPGLEQVEILQYGYAVEYDHVDPSELDAALKVKSYEGLFLAGQINGTSGYEEAGAQGIIAGINAANCVKDLEPFTLRRDQAYIAVMIDDLTTLGVLEPYRMFTSRAEYRIHLREDNADTRLTPLARKLGLVADVQWRRFEARQERMTREKSKLETNFLKPGAEANRWLKEKGSAEITDRISLAGLLRRPELRYADVCEFLPGEEAREEGMSTAETPEISVLETERVETEIKFAGYLRRQEDEIQRLRRMEAVSIPPDFSFAGIPGLSVEVRERLLQVRPGTLGQASRISGVTPAAVSLLAISLRRNLPRHDLQGPDAIHIGLPKGLGSQNEVPEGPDSSKPDGSL